MFIVDLDQSLIRSDALWDSFACLLKKRPLRIFQAFFVLFTKGIAPFKHLVFQYGELSVATLPFRKELIERIRLEKSRGVKTVLATASPHFFAKKVADHLGCFDEVLGSTPELNLKGKNKEKEIQVRFGTSDFSYVGDSSADLPIWNVCKKAIVVNGTRSVLNKVKSFGIPLEEIRDLKPLTLVFARQLRVHQWVKNVLVFIPMIAAHRLLDATTFFRTLFCFIGFSLVASGVYLINDLFDIEADRKHASKSKRPIAYGSFPVLAALLTIPVLIGLGLLMGYELGLPTVGWLCVYFCSNLIYSFKGKRIVVIDVLMLALLYTLRIEAGATAANVPLTQWLLSFSMFIFFSLAFLKRYTEILKMNAGNIPGRDYRPEDRHVVLALGTGSALVAVLVVIHYLSHPDSTKLYSHPERLWWLNPLFLYVMSRIWILAERGKVEDDPVVFVIKDKAVWIVAVVASLILWFSI